MSIWFDDGSRRKEGLPIFFEQEIDGVQCEFGEDDWQIFMIGCIPQEVIAVEIGNRKFALNRWAGRPNWHILDLGQIGPGSLQMDLYECHKGKYKAHFVRG